MTLACMRERAGRKPICQARVHRELFVEFSRRGRARGERWEFFARADEIFLRGGAGRKAEVGLKKSRLNIHRGRRGC